MIDAALKRSSVFCEGPDLRNIRRSDPSCNSDDPFLIAGVDFFYVVLRTSCEVFKLFSGYFSELCFLSLYAAENRKPVVIPAFFGELHGLSLLPLAALGAALAICVKWEMLKKEEGYPYFKIPLSEYEDRRKAQVSIIEHRAVEAGVRAAQDNLDTDRDMDDLLDQTTDAVHAQLHSYHDRSRDADPVVRAAEAHDGTMTKLEDMEEL